VRRRDGSRPAANPPGLIVAPAIQYTPFTPPSGSAPPSTPISISSHATEAEIADVELTETSVYLNGVRIPSHGVARGSVPPEPSGGRADLTFSPGTLGDAAAAAAAARGGPSGTMGTGGLRRMAHRGAAGATFGTATGGGELGVELRSAAREAADDAARGGSGGGAWAGRAAHGEVEEGGWLDPSASQTQGMSRTALLRKVRGGDGARASAHLESVDFRRESLRVKALGHGASGTVTLVVHVPTLTLLAAKTIPVTDEEKRHNVGMEFALMYEAMASFADDVGTRAGLMREQLALAALQQTAGEQPGAEDGEDGAASSPAAPVPLDGGACPYLVSFYDAFSDAAAGTVTFVMEYMNAGTLEQFVDTGGVGDEGMLQWMAWQVLKGLEWMHGRGVLHRDIKPANVLVSTLGDVKLSDLGISKRTAEDGMASTMVGTFSHMAPERADELPYDAKSDVWSLGLVLLSVAEGRGANPYEGRTFFETLGLLNDRPSPSLDADRPWSAPFRHFVDACLLKDPTRRASVAELLAHPWLDGVGARVLSGKADRLRAWIRAAQDDAADDAEAGVSQLARSELHELVGKVQRYRFRAAMTKRLPAMPRVRRSRMRWLARQLDVPPRLVERAFQKTQRKINAKLEQIAARRRAQPAEAMPVTSPSPDAADGIEGGYADGDAFAFGAPPARDRGGLRGAGLPSTSSSSASGATPSPGAPVSGGRADAADLVTGAVAEYGGGGFGRRGPAPALDVPRRGAGGGGGPRVYAAPGGALATPSAAAHRGGRFAEVGPAPARQADVFASPDSGIGRRRLSKPSLVVPPKAGGGISTIPPRGGSERRAARPRFADE